jgi:hypothetical protein
LDVNDKVKMLLMSWMRGASAADWLSLLQFKKMEEMSCATCMS